MSPARQPPLLSAGDHVVDETYPVARPVPCDFGIERAVGRGPLGLSAEQRDQSLVAGHDVHPLSLVGLIARLSTNKSRDQAG